MKMNNEFWVTFGFLAIFFVVYVGSLFFLIRHDDE